jgi:hypothetical protein
MAGVVQPKFSSGPVQALFAEPEPEISALAEPEPEPVVLV